MNKLIKNSRIEHKILFIFFIIIFIVFIVFHIKYKAGLFFDQSSMFMSGFQKIDENLRGYFLFNDRKIRFFNNVLVSIPFNLFFYNYKFIVDKIDFPTIVSTFTASYYIIHLFALLINTLISIRTKRYDLGIIAFAFYCIFCMSNMLWAVREVHITIIFYFSLLSYFLSKEKLNKFDLIPITLLLIYMFESFEITIIYGILLLIFAILYSLRKREDDNFVIKIYIGILSIFIPIYIIIRIFTHLGDVIGSGFDEYLKAFSNYFESFSYTINLLSFLTIPVVIICCLYKKHFGIKSIFFILLYYSAVVSLIIYRTELVHDAHDEICSYAGAMMLIFPVILAILIIDYFNIKLDNKAFLSNLFTVSCIVGILQLSWQIHGCFEFKQYTEYLKNLMNTSTEKLIQIPQEDFDNNKFLRLYSGYGIIHQSIILNPNYPVDKIIVPSQCREENLDWAKNIQVIEQDDSIWLPGANIIDNFIVREYHRKYIDIADITQYILEQNKQNDSTEQ